MNKTLEAPFFKWYEEAGQKYLNALKSLYVFINRPDEREDEEEMADKAREEDLQNSLSALDEICSTEHFTTLQNFDRYSQLWQKVEENINAIGHKDNSYFYYILRPFEPIMRAFDDRSTEEKEFISQCMGDAVLVIPGVSEYFEDIEVLANSPNPEVLLFAFEFLSLVNEYCNLNGVDFIAIANYYHFPIGSLSRYNVGKIVLSEQAKGYKYFPAFDTRLYRPKQATQPEQTAFALPPELNTDRAREYLNRAQGAGFIAKTSTGYKWVSGNISECAYFCALCSDALKLSKTENRIAWKPFVALFGFSSEQLIQAKNGWTKTGQPPARHKEIEAVFM